MNARWLWDVVRREAIAAIRQIRSYWSCGSREPAIRPRIPARPARDDGFTWGDREVETLTIPTVRMASRFRIPARVEERRSESLHSARSTAPGIIAAP